MINTSERTISFTERVSRSAGNTRLLAQTSDAWVQFLLDHREWLINREKTTVIELTEATMLRYRYRIEDYLDSFPNRYPWMAMAFRVVNRLHSNQDFNLSLKTVYMPSADDIMILYQKYKVNQAQLRKIKQADGQ